MTPNGIPSNEDRRPGALDADEKPSKVFGRRKEHGGLLGDAKFAFTILGTARI